MELADSALGAVDDQLQLALDVVTDALHHPSRSSLAAAEDDEVVGVSSKGVPAFLQFAIKVIEKDVRQQRAQRPALWHSFESRFL